MHGAPHNVSLWTAQMAYTLQVTASHDWQMSQSVKNPHVIHSISGRRNILT